jgi:hypothetical protein
MTRLSFTTAAMGLLLLVSPLASAKERKPRPAPEHRETTPATADAVAKEAKERAAKKACLTGDPVRGVEILTDLFIDTNDATYVFNQGRCYEQSNRYEDALGRFREYLRKARNASDTERAEAEKHIADCQALLEQKRGAGGDSKAGEPATAPVPSAGPPVPPPATEPLVARPVVTTGPAGFGLRTAGLVTSVLGVAALGGAIALNVKYNTMADGLMDKWDNGVESSANDYKTMAIIGYSAGAVCVATGLLLYIVGRNAGQPMLGPTVVAGGPGAALSGGF